MTTINDQMAEWGRKGGLSRSAKKREAARRNVAAARARIGKAVPAAQQPPAPAPQAYPRVLVAQPTEGK